MKSNEQLTAEEISEIAQSHFTKTRPGPLTDKIVNEMYGFEEGYKIASEHFSQQIAALREEIHTRTKNLVEITQDWRRANDAGNRLKKEVEELEQKNYDLTTLISEALIQLKYLDSCFPTSNTPIIISQIETKLDNLNT